MRFPFQTLAILATLALLNTACGSKEPSGPSGGGTGDPAALQIASGNAQQAAPSEVVPTTVSVKVADASGNPVSGVSVGFRVDSGGGSITNSSAATNSAGIASPGTWTLGSAEGRNVLLVTVGSLAPIRIYATAVRGVVAIPPQTIGSNGGTVIVNTPGSPINGFKLEVPSGSFSASQTVTISTAPSSSLVLPGEAIAAGPIITVHTTHSGYASHPMYITIPNAVPDGMFPAIVLIGANGPEEVLSTFSYNSTSMKAWTRHLDGGRLASAQGAAALRDGDDTSLQMIQVYVPMTSLYRRLDTGFKIGIDNWEFHPISTVISPSISEGMLETEAWYYTQFRSGLRREQPALYKQFQESDGIENSNRRGIRWSAAESFYAATTTNDGLKSVERAHGTDNPDEMTKIAFLNIRVALRLYEDNPVTVQLLSYSGGNVEYQADALVVAADRHAPTRELFLVTSVDPLHELVIPETANGGPINVTLQNLPGTYTTLLTAGASQSMDLATLKANYAKVSAGTIGDDIFPKYRLMSAWGSDVGQAAPVDLLQHFWLNQETPKLVYAECTTCRGIDRPTQIPAGSAKVTGAAWYTTLGGTLWGAQGGGPLLAAKLEDPGTIQSAGELYAYGGDNQIAWLDYAKWNVKHAAAGILPLLPATSIGTDFTMVMDITNPPTGIEYFWDFGDNTTAVSATKDVIHQWSTIGGKNVTATARYITTKEPIAKEKAVVSVGLPVWKFTTADVFFDTGSPTPFRPGSSDVATPNWNYYLQLVTDLKDKVTQGGLMYLAAPQIIGGSTQSQGVYLLDALQLTQANVNSSLLFPPHNNPVRPTGTQVRATGMLSGLTPKQPADNLLLNEAIIQTGNTTAGTFKSTTWDVWTTYTTTVQTYWPFLVRTSDVTFNGNQATGTITFFVRNYQEFKSPPSPETLRWTLRINFTATRIQ